MQGVYIDYYFHCKRQLWLYAKNIRMEHTSEDVEIGKFISENTYDRKIHEIYLSDCDNNEGVIDFMDKKRKIIHEVKKSKSIEEATVWQVKYYLYYLKKFGMENIIGVIDYPLLRRNLVVELDKNDEEKIEEVIKDIESIVAMPSPPTANKMKICSKCAYYELCFI